MKWILSRRWFQIPAALVLLLAAGLLACAWYFRIWSWRDLQVYRMMSRECHPIWEDLHWGRISAGQDVEAVIAQTKPVRVERFGNYVMLGYQEGLCFTGITLVARDGKLVAASAWSCTWDRTFFDTLSSEAWQAYSRAFEVHLKARLKAQKDSA
jgi:hypothetical protein